MGYTLSFSMPQHSPGFGHGAAGFLAVPQQPEPAVDVEGDEPQLHEQVEDEPPAAPPEGMGILFAAALHGEYAGGLEQALHDLEVAADAEIERNRALSQLKDDTLQVQFNVATGICFTTGACMSAFGTPLMPVAVGVAAVAAVGIAESLGLVESPLARQMQIVSAAMACGGALSILTAAAPLAAPSYVGPAIAAAASTVKFSLDHTRISRAAAKLKIE